MILTGAQGPTRAGDRHKRPLSIAVVLVVTLLSASTASADWLFTPFIGAAFGTNTSFVLLETGAASTTQLIFGGSAAVLSRGVFGAEADFAYAPRFFERDNRAGNIVGSNVSTLSGNIILALPLSVTRDSLRPYAVGGLGLMHAAATDAFDVFTFDESFAGVNLGGGAIGLISPRSGFRFEIRHFRSLGDSPNGLTGETGPRLSFWRATVGVVIRLEN